MTSLSNMYNLCALQFTILFIIIKSPELGIWGLRFYSAVQKVAFRPVWTVAVKTMCFLAY